MYSLQPHQTSFTLQKYLHKQNCTCSPNSSGTIIDRKLIGTSEKHNWSSRPATNMNYNFLKILLSYLQLYYSHLNMILQLTRKINPMNASLSKTWTESDMLL